MKNNQIDLTALERVATAGDPRDTVGVSRRWLAQVFAEMGAHRRQAPVLDYSPFHTAPIGGTVTAASVAQLPA